MDDPIAEIRKRLEKYPDARTEEDARSIRFVPSSPDGFVVGFYVDRDGYTVAFEGWHERFRTVDEAFNCFAFGLSDACRLKIVSRGGKPHRWIVEQLRDGTWVPDGETGLLLFQFWRPPRVDYRQKALIKAAPRLAG